MDNIGILTNQMDEKDQLFFLLNQYKKIGHYTANKENNLRVDNLRDKILLLIFSLKTTLSIEVIMESLSHLGFAPNLLYNDEMWALFFEGFQSVYYGDIPSDVSLSFHVKAKHWHNSIQEAIDFGLNNFFNLNIK